MSLSKNWLTFASVFYLMLGGVLCFLGAVVQRVINEDFSQYSLYTSIPSILIIALGGSLIATALLCLVSIGCRSPVLLFVYIITLAILLIVELSVGAGAFTSKSHMLGLVKESMRTSEILYTSDRSASASWDSLQKTLHCCGVDHHEEWFNYLKSRSLPDSCCFRPTKSCGGNALSTGKFYRTGCFVAITRWARSYTIASAILLTFIVIFQILSLLCARIYLLYILKSDMNSMRFRTG